MAIIYPDIDSIGWGDDVNDNFRELSQNDTDIKTTIGTETMGTTATTLKGAIAEHEEQINNNTTQLNEMANQNLIINGDFRVCQRTPKDGTSVFKYGTSNADGVNFYSADRWRTIQSATGTTATLDIRTRTDGVKFLAIENILKPSNCIWGLCQTFEIGELPCATYTISFEYVWSATTNLRILGLSNEINVTVPMSSTWTKFSYTFTVDTTNTSIYIGFYKMGDAITTAQSMYFTNVKLELGNKATPFVPRPYAEELAICKRYYEVIGRDYGSVTMTRTDGFFVIYEKYSVEKRIVPTITIPSDLTGTIEVIGIHTATPTGVGTSTTKKGLRITGTVTDTLAHVCFDYNMKITCDAEIY